MLTPPEQSKPKLKQTKKIIKSILIKAIKDIFFLPCIVDQPVYAIILEFEISNAIYKHLKILKK